MSENMFKFLEFCIDTYGGSYSIQGNLIFLNSGEDNFKFWKTDLNKGKEIPLYHHNTNNEFFHKQGTYKSVFYMLFYAFSHDTYKKGHIKREPEDFIRFKADSRRYAGVFF